MTSSVFVVVVVEIWIVGIVDVAPWFWGQTALPSVRDR